MQKRSPGKTDSNEKFIHEMSHSVLFHRAAMFRL